VGQSKSIVPQPNSEKPLANGNGNGNGIPPLPSSITVEMMEEVESTMYFRRSASAVAGELYGISRMGSQAS